MPGLCKQLGLSVSELQEPNPRITCPNIDTSKSYCVVGTVTEDLPGTTLTTTASTVTTTTPRTTTTTNQPPTTTNPTAPTRPCLALQTIATVSIGSHQATICTNLWFDYYVCVRFPAQPLLLFQQEEVHDWSYPQQTGIISNCNKYHQVESGDGCASIASAYGISLSNFYSWNPAVGSSCGALWLGYHVCVGTSTFQPTTTSTTSQTATTTATTAPGPSPAQPNLIKACTSYYKAQAGDTCQEIVEEKYPYVNSLALFVRWNPAVGYSCSSLLSGYYYYVDLTGSGPIAYKMLVAS
ncbi:hypothetical protein BDW60DRAFT_216720 [Aspergillus nidulans var. acristatus]